MIIQSIDLKKSYTLQSYCTFFNHQRVVYLSRGRKGFLMKSNNEEIWFLKPPDVKGIDPGRTFMMPNLDYVMTEFLSL